jgi:sensor histidine kinase YesM
MVILGVLFDAQGEADEARIEKAFITIFFVALIPSVLSFYAFYYFLFPQHLRHKSLLLSAFYGLLIAVGTGSIGYILENNSGPACDEKGEFSIVGILLFMSFIPLVSGVVALVIRGFITWIEEFKLKEMLKQKNVEMEMALVKSQLDPHFLFNTLNNIDILILKNATEASDYLNKLSDIIRFVLFETKTEQIALAKEIEYIEKFIALQKIRTANAQYVHYTVQGAPGHKKIAPMAFIPFIENAFKHTTNKKVENAITIHIQIEDQFIKLECINKYDAARKPQQAHNGLGNHLIEKRLQLIYQEKHTLAVTNENDLYSVSLTIFNA